MDRAKGMDKIREKRVIFLSFLLLMVLGIAFTGCGDNNQEPEPGRIIEEDRATWWTPGNEPVAGGNPLEIPLPEEVNPRGKEVLSITGEGIGKWLSFTIEELKDLAQTTSGAAVTSGGGLYLEQVFSTLDNWPSNKFMVAKGLDVELLLQMAEIDERASMFTIETTGGYYLFLTKDQLLGKRFYFPNILKGTSYGSKRVKPMIAWASSDESQILADAKEDGLRLFIGQRGLSDVNGIIAMENIKGIMVSFRQPEKWSEPQIAFENGNLVISHEYMDQVKLHYTQDGRSPDLNSPVYNPSTTFLQPDFIKPIPVTKSGKIKVKAVGYGKEDSLVVEFSY